MYAPKGIGALYVHTGLTLEPTIYGGGQEHGRRSGTENVAALGEAARLAGDHPDLQRLRDRLHERLPGRVRLNGHPTQRLPNTLNVSVEGVLGRHLLAAAPDIAASTGSTCHEGIDEPPAVLTAMGLSAERANAAVRLTLGRPTTEADITRASAALTAAYADLAPTVTSR